MPKRINTAGLLNGSVASLKRLLTTLKYLIDLLCFIASYWLAYYIRFEAIIPLETFAVFKNTLGIFIIGFLTCDILFRLSRGVWRYTSLRDIVNIIIFVLAGNGLSITLGVIILPDTMIEIPRSIYVINSLFVFLSISGARLFYRMLFDRVRQMRKIRENVLIIGDQDIAASLQYSILRDYLHQFKIVGFITSDKNSLGHTINALPILGLLRDVPDLVKRKDIKYIFIAVDRATNEEMKRIIKLSQQTGAIVRIVPSILDVVNGKFSLKDLREIRFEDYLERKPVEFYVERLRDEFYQKTILVTGGGGSIGASICKELIRFVPRKLIILDISENNLFKIEYALDEICKKEKLNEIEIIYSIGDIKDDLCLRDIFQNANIDYVIHAAARKHVHLSEINPHEVVATNIGGLLKVMEVATHCQVKKFIYISTDKAVEPISIMGASKRVGELLIKSFSRGPTSQTTFIAVRFGNVIGSSGNVVEIFTEQLKNNQPLTITDPQMQRYFMSLDEATRLILRAISIGQTGDIFVLDMGNPVKIKNLAYDMALFYGKHLKETDIIYIGKRGGDKLSEKLYSEKEKVLPTSFAKILRVEDDTNTDGLIERAKELCNNVYKINKEQVQQDLFSLIGATSSIKVENEK